MAHNGFPTPSTSTAMSFPLASTMPRSYDEFMHAAQQASSLRKQLDNFESQLYTNELARLRTAVLEGRDAQRRLIELFGGSKEAAANYISHPTTQASLFQPATEQQPMGWQMQGQQQASLRGIHVASSPRIQEVSQQQTVKNNTPPSYHPPPQQATNSTLPRRAVPPTTVNPQHIHLNAPSHFNDQGVSQLPNNNFSSSSVNGANNFSSSSLNGANSFASSSLNGALELTIVSSVKYVRDAEMDKAIAFVKAKGTSLLFRDLLIRQVNGEVHIDFAGKGSAFAAAAISNAKSRGPVPPAKAPVADTPLVTALNHLQPQESSRSSTMGAVPNLTTRKEPHEQPKVGTLPPTTTPKLAPSSKMPETEPSLPSSSKVAEEMIDIDDSPPPTASPSKLKIQPDQKRLAQSILIALGKRPRDVEDTGSVSAPPVKKINSTPQESSTNIASSSTASVAPVRATLEQSLAARQNVFDSQISTTLPAMDSTLRASSYAPYSVESKKPPVMVFHSIEPTPEPPVEQVPLFLSSPAPSEKSVKQPVWRIKDVLIPPPPNWVRKDLARMRERDLKGKEEQEEAEEAMTPAELHVRLDLSSGADDEEHALQVVQTQMRALKCEWKDCDSVLNCQESLYQHLLKHGDSTGFSCQWHQCAETLQSHQKWKVHVASHALQPVYCPYQGCDQTCPDARTYMNHSQVSHPNDELRGSAKRLMTLKPVNIPNVPSVIPSYRAVPRMIVPSLISEERHQKLGPWVLGKMHNDVEGMSVLTSVAQVRSQNKYQYVLGAGSVSDRPSRGYRRKMPDLQHEVTEMLSEGLVLWPSERMLQEQAERFRAEEEAEKESKARENEADIE